jgi:hypothetical protein
MGETMFASARTPILSGKGVGVLLAVAFAAICLAPYQGRLKSASLFSDDVPRIADLQVMPLKTMLVRPFNEHLGPLFETVSFVTWHLSGRRLVAAPLAFTLAAFLPFVLVLGLLGVVARRELGSTTAALAAVAIFSQSPAYFEAVAWYGASNFTWALLMSLAAWYGGTRGREASGVWSRAAWWGVSALSALAAPAFSAIGLLAAPVGIVAATTAPRGPGLTTRRRWLLAGAAAPAAGTLAYLALASTCHYHEIVADSLHHKGDLAIGLPSIARAPIDVLIPGLAGVTDLDVLLAPSGIDLVLFGLALAGVLAWVWVGTGAGSRRPAIVGGLVLILGGYGLIYCVRTADGPYWILRVERYHLFPQLGLSLIIAAALRPWLSRFDPRPVTGLMLAIALALVLLLAHRGEFQRKTKRYRFPDQIGTLAALDDLRAICTEHRITRGQALAALDPIRTRWYNRGENALVMLAATVDRPGLPDALVRPTLLAALTPAQREALCGGMDASPYLRPTGAPEAAAVAVGQLTDAWNFRKTGAEGHYVSEGRPSYLEYQWTGCQGVSPDRARASARFLCITTSAVQDKAMEVWWSDGAGRWSQTRSVRWKPDPAQPEQPLALPLDRLPHWNPAAASRIRLIFRVSGPVVVGAPRLLR